jgi:hypothetical protein
MSADFLEELCSCAQKMSPVCWTQKLTTGELSCAIFPYIEVCCFLEAEKRLRRLKLHTAVKWRNLELQWYQIWGHHIKWGSLKPEDATHNLKFLRTYSSYFQLADRDSCSDGIKFPDILGFCVGPLRSRTNWNQWSVSPFATVQFFRWPVA